MPEHTDKPRPNEHLDADQTRFTVAQAAQLLGLSAEAVRSRIQRGTLASVKESGTVYVLLDSEQAHPDEHPNDRPDERLSADQTPFIESLQEQIDWLRREVERKDTLLMTLMQRVPELEAPREPREAPETASEDEDKVERHPRKR